MDFADQGSLKGGEVDYMANMMKILQGNEHVEEISRDDVVNVNYPVYGGSPTKTKKAKHEEVAKTLIDIELDASDSDDVEIHKHGGSFSSNYSNLSFVDEEEVREKAIQKQY